MPVCLELRLRPSLAARVVDADLILRELLGDETSTLRQTEAWEAIEAVQRLSVPGMDEAWTEIGIRTRFADPVD